MWKFLLRNHHSAKKKKNHLNAQRKIINEYQQNSIRAYRHTWTWGELLDLPPGTSQNFSTVCHWNSPPPSHCNCSMLVPEVVQYLKTFNQTVLFVFFQDNFIFQIPFLSGLEFYKIKMIHGLLFFLKKSISFL